MTHRERQPTLAGPEFAVRVTPPGAAVHDDLTAVEVETDATISRLLRGHSARVMGRSGCMTLLPGSHHLMHLNTAAEHIAGVSACVGTAMLLGDGLNDGSELGAQAEHVVRPPGHRIVHGR
jgi:hypothetical protein